MAEENLFRQLENRAEKFNIRRFQFNSDYERETGITQQLSRLIVRGNEIKAGTRGGILDTPLFWD